MYTRCPECQTAFNITVAQLKVRDGLVRCGRCDSVFRADLRLFAAPAEGAAAKPDRETEISFAFEPNDTDSEYIDIGDNEAEIPVVSDLSLFYAPRRGPPPLVWALGAALMATVLLGQFSYFYRNELAQLPNLRPALARFCEWARCELAPATASDVPELLDTRIAPHSRYVNILRIRTRMVNRSAKPLPPPLMEVTLTDSDGNLLARRTFTPREYLGSRRAAAAPLSPNVVITALLDVTNPDNKAAGFEVHLLPQQTTRAN